jgi:pyridoxamine 5'-phosphate oxidase
MMNLNEKLENLRESYQGAELDIKDCKLNPELQFDYWMENAISAHCDEPNAFVLSTVGSDNKPHARVVLLKGIHEGKLIFYTNYKSLKGNQIEANANIAMTFLWLPLLRQVRIEGVISKITNEVSEEYFQKRPRGSQLGAIASPQSQRVNSRQDLEIMFNEVSEKYSNVEKLPRPAHWGGYAITPNFYEFWQGRANRMHDRICYEKADNGWSLFRLAP